MEQNYFKEVFGLENEVALITGAGSGIGFAIALALGRAGAKIIVNDLSEDVCADACGLLSKQGIETLSACFDVSEPNDVEAAVTKAIKQFSKISILVCCAGNQNRNSLIHQTAKDRQAIFDVHVHGAFNCIQAVLPSMIEHKSGRIILMSSIAAFATMPGISAYATAKGALSALTRATAVEYAEDGITCNALAPGFVRTSFTAALQEKNEFNEFLKSAVPMQRWAEPNDIAHTAVYLSSKASSFVSGQVIAIDGGLLAKM